MREVIVVGAGLAGCEAAYKLAKLGVKVRLYEQKPVKKHEAFKTDLYSELICSNSLRSDDLYNAVGLLKEEMRTLDSLIMEAADRNRVEAGKSLAVDREGFSRYITERIDRTYRLGEFHEMLGSQQRLKLRGIEAGTGFLHARQIAVTQNGLDARKLTVKTEDEKLHRLLLGWRAGIRNATARRQTALVADTDGMSIVAQGMSTHPLHRTAGINHTFQGDVKMITDVAPTVHHHMVVAQLL